MGKAVDKKGNGRQQGKNVPTTSDGRKTKRQDGAEWTSCFKEGARPTPQNRLRQKTARIPGRTHLTARAVAVVMTPNMGSEIQRDPSWGLYSSMDCKVLSECECVHV